MDTEGGEGIPGEPEKEPEKEIAGEPEPETPGEQEMEIAAHATDTVHEGGDAEVLDKDTVLPGDRNEGAEDLISHIEGELAAEKESQAEKDHSDDVRATIRRFMDDLPGSQCFKERMAMKTKLDQEWDELQLRLSDPNASAIAYIESRKDQYRERYGAMTAEEKRQEKATRQLQLPKAANGFLCEVDPLAIKPLDAEIAFQDYVCTGAIGTPEYFAEALTRNQPVYGDSYNNVECIPQEVYEAKKASGTSKTGKPIGKKAYHEMRLTECYKSSANAYTQLMKKVYRICTMCISAPLNGAPQTRYEAGKEIEFYCTNCLYNPKDKSKKLAQLVARGKFLPPEQIEVMSEKGSIVDYKCGLEVREVFLHDVDCSLCFSQQFGYGLDLQSNGPGYWIHRSVNIPEIVGDHYDMICMTINEKKYDDPTAPGIRINFGDLEYKHDIRKYCPLDPTTAAEHFPHLLDAKEQKWSQGRITYWFISNHNLTREFANVIPRAAPKRKPGAGFGFKKEHDVFEKGLKGITGGAGKLKRPMPKYPCIDNSFCSHIQLSEFSLLWGGQATTPPVRVRATKKRTRKNLRKKTFVTPVVHQPAHCDGETNNVKIADNMLLQGLFKPGTLILPLEKERPIWIVNGETKIQGKYGEALFFLVISPMVDCHTYQEKMIHSITLPFTFTSIHVFISA